jgi:phage terminase large subunit
VTILDISTPKVFAPFLYRSRYRASYGGRGSGKSHNVAENLISDHLCERGLASVCIREVQRTLKQSSKRLIEQKLDKFKLGERDGFKVFNEAIQAPGDGLIMFQGMQDHTAESIKSLEGFKRAVIEEAQTISAHSLMLLRPTIRAEGSEIWASWNPRRKSDPIDVMFRGLEVPTGSVIVRSSWRDNPWFTAELEQERLDCLRMEPEQYDHVWEGGYVTVASGAYFAKDLAAAKLQNRIGRVAADPMMTYRAHWDIGGTGAKADACAIWISQFIGTEVRVLDYYEAVGQPLSVHVQWLRDHGYKGALCVLPHDGDTHDKVHSVSFASALRQAQFEVRVVPNMGAGAANARIEAVRRLFPSIYFNAETTESGRDALGWYHEKRDESRSIGLGPAHDWASHGADAFGLMAVDKATMSKKTTGNLKFRSEFA